MTKRLDHTKYEILQPIFQVFQRTLCLWWRHYDRTLVAQRFQNMVRQTANVIMYYESDVINNEH